MLLCFIIIIGGITLYLLGGVLLVVFQKKILFRPGRTIFAEPADVGLCFEDLYFDTADGVSLHGWFIPAARAELTVLFCHENAGTLSHRLGTAAIWHQAKVNFFIFSYRGYGKSTGSPSEAGLYADADAAWRLLTETRRISPEKIIIAGRSLGGAPAARLAAAVKPAAFICESAFLSVPAMARHKFPFYPFPRLLRYSFNTVGYVAAITVPKLFIHSRDDEIVPFEHGEALFAAAPEPKTFAALRGSHDCCYHDSREIYIAALKALLHDLAAPAVFEKSR